MTLYDVVLLFAWIFGTGLVLLVLWLAVAIVIGWRQEHEATRKSINRHADRLRQEHDPNDAARWKRLNADTRAAIDDVDQDRNVERASSIDEMIERLNR